MSLIAQALTLDENGLSARDHSTSSATASFVADSKWGDAERHLRLGSERSQNGDYRRAIVCFSDGLRIDPDHADLYAQRGDAYRLVGEVELALADYDASLRLKPAALLPLLGRAAVYCQTGDFAKAHADA